MKILDTTIRDGSYAVDFKFSCRDVEDIVSKSSRLGIEYIEIGHGQGLNASGAEHGYALHSDVEYMRAARKASRAAKLGVFCIPGIARLEDLDTAKENGMDFVRIGVNASEYSLAEPYIRRAKEKGLQVFVNFMKSYAVTPEKLAEAAQFSDSCGASGVYIVDSAGCMMPEQIERYIQAIRKRTDIKIGFHGHDNMGLAVFNTVYCIEKGIDFVDCSYQGLGRSCGNAALEQVVMVLKRKNYELGFDLPRTLEYGYSALRNIVNPMRLTNPLDYICGYCGFHSSYLKYIYRCSNEMSVDPLRLILAYCEKDCVGMDYGKLTEVAALLPIDDGLNPYGFGDSIEF